MDAVYEIDSAFPWFFATFSFIMGAVVGSFLNVCIYRIPAKKSIISPGSTCACGQAIKWYDNIPILSWFILRGKARCCKAPYSFRYPFIEALTGAFFLFAWLSHEPIPALCIMAFASMLVCGSFIDFDHMEIPDRFSLGTVALGFALSVIFPQLQGHLTGDPISASAKSGLDSLLGLLVGSGTILWIGIIAETLLKKDAMGFGDVKLMGGIGAFLGWQGALFSIFGGALLGCVGLLLWLPFKGRNKKEPEPDTNQGDEDVPEGNYIPFGPMLSGGALLYAFFMKDLVTKYFDQFSFITQ